VLTLVGLIRAGGFEATFTSGRANHSDCPLTLSARRHSKKRIRSFLLLKICEIVLPWIDDSFAYL
jgi:hypothetical protein